MCLHAPYNSQELSAGDSSFNAAIMMTCSFLCQADVFVWAVCSSAHKLRCLQFGYVVEWVQAWLLVQHVLSQTGASWLFCLTRESVNERQETVVEWCVMVCCCCCCEAVLSIEQVQF